MGHKRRKKRWHERLDWGAVILGGCVCGALGIAALWAGATWWARARLANTGRRVTAGVNEAWLVTSNPDGQISGDARILVEYEFVPEDGSAPVRNRIGVRAVTFAVRGDIDQVKRGGIDVVYLPSDPSWNYPAAEARAWAN